MAHLSRPLWHGKAFSFAAALLAALLSCCGLFCPLAAAQESSKRLTNQDVISMTSLGFTGGKAGIKKEKQIPFRAEHSGIRVYKVTLDSDLNPGEYAFFLGTGAQSNMSGGDLGASRSGGNATGKIYDFSIPQ
jgi:hypothetical protein